MYNSDDNNLLTFLYLCVYFFLQKLNLILKMNLMKT